MRIETMLTTEEVADLIRTTAAGVANMRYRGVGPRGVRVGRRVLYPESEVLAWLEARADTAGGEPA
jgi:predicted DNA-binding transcriptional regulator AlpA